jgi:uncharacterized protein YcbX
MVAVMVGRMTVSEIWRFPAKSMGGEQVEQVSVGELGIKGDRAWAIRDVTNGTILTARREPLLLMATAALANGRPTIRLEDGRQLSTDDELSAWLERPVELVPAGSTPGTYENPRDIEREDDWRSWQGPIGSFHDGESRMSMVSTRSLGDHERRRFRLNLVLEGADEDLDEDRLVGHDLTIGSVGIHVRKQIERCIMVTRAQPGIEADRSVLKRVARERGNRMGVGLLVYREGTLAVGDVLHPVPD